MGSIIEELVTWLESERGIYANAAEQLGMSLTLPVARNIVTVESETSSTVERRVVQVSPMALLPYAWTLGGYVARLADRPTPGMAILAAFGERCRVWWPVGAQAVAGDLLAFIDQRLLASVRHKYLAGLESLEKPNRELADRLARDLLALIEGDTVEFMTWLPLGGLRFSDDPTEVGNVRFRTLTPEELGDLLTDDPFVGLTRHRRVPPPIDIQHERWVMEVRTPCRKDSEPPAGLWAKRVVLGLQLLGYEPHGKGEAATWTAPGPPLWSGGQSFRLPPSGSTRDCPRDDLAHAIMLADLIPDEAFYIPKRQGEVALHRFLLGAAHEDPADALIDFVTALEALLLAGQDDRGEFRFRFSAYGATFLGRSPEERRDIFRRLRDMYDTRSKLVHGTAPIPRQKVAGSAPDARALTGKMLVKALEEGWPTKERLQALLLA